MNIQRKENLNEYNPERIYCMGAECQKQLILSVLSVELHNTFLQ